MAIKQELIRIVGAENVFDDAKRFQRHAKGHSLCAHSMPSYVAQSKNAKEVERLIRMANENKVPIVPFSIGIHFNGNTILKQASVVLDLRRMNRILAVDERNRLGKGGV
jgi:glycolate oxidase